jgi:hypothetical protein
VSKEKFLSAFPAAPNTVNKTVIAAAGLGPLVEVRTVSALVHLTILNARRAQAVANILSRARLQLTKTPEPRSSETAK